MNRRGNTQYYVHTLGLWIPGDGLFIPRNTFQTHEDTFTPPGAGLQLSEGWLQSTGNGLQPSGNGLQPPEDEHQPPGDGLQHLKMDSTHMKMDCREFKGLQQFKVAIVNVQVAKMQPHVSINLQVARMHPQVARVQVAIYQKMNVYQQISNYTINKNREYNTKPGLEPATSQLRAQYPNHQTNRDQADKISSPVRWRRTPPACRWTLPEDALQSSENVSKKIIGRVDPSFNRWG